MLQYQLFLIIRNYCINYCINYCTNNYCINIWIKCILKLVPILIQWPTLNQIVDIEQKFRNIAGFPGMIKYCI